MSVGKGVLIDNGSIFKLQMAGTFSFSSRLNKNVNIVKTID